MLCPYFLSPHLTNYLLRFCISNVIYSPLAVMQQSLSIQYTVSVLPAASPLPAGLLSFNFKLSFEEKDFRSDTKTTTTTVTSTTSNTVSAPCYCPIGIPEDTRKKPEWERFSFYVLGLGLVDYIQNNAI